MENNYNSDEITLKELILKIIEFKNEVLRNWMWVFLVALSFAGYMYYKASITPVQYRADLTFMINDDDHNSGSNVASLLGQLGMGGGSNGQSNPLTMLQLVKSRKISEKVLFKKLSIDNRTDYLANHLISNLEENNRWFYLSWYKRIYKKQSSFIGFRFESSVIDSFSRTENKAFKKLVKIVTGAKGNLSTSFDELTGIMNLSYIGYNENVSLNLVNHYYTSLSNYYFNKTVEKQEKNYNLIKAKVDSIYTELSSKEYQLANFRDKNLVLISRKDQLSSSRLQRDIIGLSSLYSTAVQNMELAEYAYNLKKPLVQEIDKPLFPLKTVRNSKTKSLIIGFITGFFLMSFYFIGKKVFKDIMK